MNLAQDTLVSKRGDQPPRHQGRQEEKETISLTGTLRIDDPLWLFLALLASWRLEFQFHERCACNRIVVVRVDILKPQRTIHGYRLVHLAG